MDCLIFLERHILIIFASTRVILSFGDTGGEHTSYRDITISVFATEI